MQLICYRIMRSLKAPIVCCLIFSILLISSCKKDDPPTPPTVKTTIISEITQSTATGGGEIEDNGGEPVTKRGVCWGATNSPTISGDKTTDGAGDGSFISRITGLIPGNLYYVRAYATNSVGTGYGKPISFNTNPVSLSEITTSDVIDITAISAKGGGYIASAGGGEVTARGVCWSSINQTPTTSDSKTTDGSGIGSFTSTLTALEYNKTYYVRAYAINSAGTSYGLVKSFITLPVPPSVTTMEVTNRSYKTATGGGEVISDGGSPVTDRGLCFATHLDPKFNENNLPSGSGIGSFSVEITGLTPNTEYHVRAYAATTADTSYGADKTFTTLPVTLPQLTTLAFSAITNNSASTGGEITSDGGEAVIARGVCWSLSESPTVDNEKSVNGTGVGSFASTISNLLPATTYYVRAYATTIFGTGYGNQQNLTTNASLPTVSTNSITDIGHRSVTTGGNITADGGSTITSRGVCWSTDNTPTIEDEKTNNGAGAGPFISQIAGLTPKSSYYVRAYATNNLGTSYGTALPFTTISTTPTIITADIFGITQTSAVSGGMITDDGGEPILSKGICWSTSSPATISSSHNDQGPGDDQFSCDLSPLIGNTTYYVRAYATNVKGISYGQELTFKSAPLIPVVTTDEVIDITSSSCMVRGNVTSDGGGTILTRAVCWSLNPNPTNQDDCVFLGPGIGPFSATINGLEANTTYYVRAYVASTGGESYGQVLSFKTLPTPVVDIDGNSYKVVQIGTQFWMAENLKTTTFKNGSQIHLVTDFSQWANLTSQAYCWYNNSVTNKDTYGALYNWYAVATENLCPTGWHVPTDTEWTIFTNFLGGENGAGGKLKEIGATHWSSPNTGATNEYGFTALPGGYRSMENGSLAIGLYGLWWSSTASTASNAWYRSMYFDDDDVYRSSFYPVVSGLSVRCIKD